MIKISEKESRLLKKIIELRKPNMVQWIEAYCINDLSISQYNQLREVILDEFLENGVKEEDATLYGEQLEHLIDTLGHFVYEKEKITNGACRCFHK